MMFDKKSAAVGPPKLYVRFAIAPKGSATEQGLVAHVPPMLNEDKSTKATNRTPIIELNASFMPTIR